MTGSHSLIISEWPAPVRVKAVSTTRLGGASLPPWDSFNLGAHVGDDPAAVDLNREILGNLIGRGVQTIHWLEQVHGDQVLDVPAAARDRRADAATTTSRGHACAILTADCLPVLFCDDRGERVAAAHAGWRGLLSGVLENTLGRFAEPGRVMVWLGPAIGPGSFEVGPEVRQAFVAKDPAAIECFRPSPHTAGHFMANIYGLAQSRLKSAGVIAIFGGNRCTVREPDCFFSFRRDGLTGRQASLIWLE